MRRIRLLLEYDGTGFSGWQVQPGMRTVQGEVQEALARMMEAPVKLIGSGRTDAGVHAIGQVAHAEVPKEIPAVNIAMGLNSSLSRDIRILDCGDVPPTFHAQRSARGKLYRYAILNSPTPTALDRFRVWHIRSPLDLVKMNSGASFLRGEHDFTSFKSAGDETTTVRNLRRLDIEKDGDRISLMFEANGFLKHMVRNITGTLVQVGLGRMAPDKVKTVLENLSRDNAPPKAPPQGLTLMEVYY
ncbi:MAG: tRNA pseudouridine(38-40) synthase TruA [bacterium]|nr:tRNA pseudouridine(38-40) synthase TruA [bacterium]